MHEDARTVPSGTLPEELAGVAEQLRRITVEVTDAGRRGGGSGVLWRSDGLVVSNAHVVRGRTARVRLEDGRRLEARVVARDDARDLVALRTEAHGLPAAEPGEPDGLRPGEVVLALGSPLGWTGALSWGVVHALERYGSTGVLRWVRTDLELAPGNSGGPLADAAGRVVGINARIEGRAGLAVPSSAVAAFLARGTTAAPLGITARPVGVVGLAGRSAGLLVLDVAPGSPCAAAGLARGDVLVGIAGAPLREPGDLRVIANEAAPGAPVSLEALRDGRRVGLALSLPAPPAATAA